MLTIKVALPRVHTAGSNAHDDAHLEVGQHGFALFLAPDAEAPVLDVDGTPEQLDAVVHALHAALTAQRTPAAISESEPVQMALPDSEMEAWRA